MLYSFLEPFFAAFSTVFLLEAFLALVICQAGHPAFILLPFLSFSCFPATTRAAMLIGSIALARAGGAATSRPSSVL